MQEKEKKKKCTVQIVAEPLGFEKSGLFSQDQVKVFIFFI